MSSSSLRYGARLQSAGESPVPVAISTAAELLTRTVELVIERAPSIAAAAAEELRPSVLALHFRDGSEATLAARLNSLVVSPQITEPSVRCFFSDQALVRLYDLELRSSEVLEQGAFDVKGPVEEVLAVWRTFRLLAQRAAGLRPVQSIWRAYRAGKELAFADNAAALPERPGPGACPPDAASVVRKGGDKVERSASVATTRVLWDRNSGEGWWTFGGPRDADVFDVMESCRRRVAAEILRRIPKRRPVDSLYGLMRDYPGRGGKGLRPTLCIASCGAFGGQHEDALPVAAAVEMFHNAFLIHDDIEDDSINRRGEPCLHVKHGIGLAVNAGDSLNLLAVETVFKNIEELGLARTLGLMGEIIAMCRESLEGQAIELGWIHKNVVPRRDADYVNMVTKKTGWYTCCSPCRLGAMAAGHSRSCELDLLSDVFKEVGVAFQIQDDVLNLIGEEDLYGKEALGDLLEGKRTLMLIRLMRRVPKSKRDALLEWLSLPRSGRTEAECRDVVELMQANGAIEYSQGVAARHAARAATLFEEKLSFLPESEDKAVLRQIIHYANTRML